MQCPSHNSIDKALIFIVHGSRREASADEFEQMLKQLNPQSAHPCFTAYMELQSPTLQERISDLADQGFSEIDIIPLFILEGKHIAKDIPLQVQHCHQEFPDLAINLKPHLSQQNSFLQALIQISKEQ